MQKHDETSLYISGLLIKTIINKIRPTIRRGRPPKDRKTDLNPVVNGWEVPLLHSGHGVSGYTLQVEISCPPT